MGNELKNKILEYNGIMKEEIPKNNLWLLDGVFRVYDKLDTCKNGKVENFLKSNGKPT